MTEDSVLAAADLRNLLRYEADTGKLFWLPRSRDGFKSSRAYGAWHSNFCGKEALTAVNSEGYRLGTIWSRRLKAHRVAWAIVHGEWPAGEIDHINGDRSDNRLSNLRDVPKSLNQRNAKMQSNNTSGVTGVCWCNTRHKWRVAVKVGDKTLHLGYFHSKAAASAARSAANDRYGFTARHGKAA